MLSITANVIRIYTDIKQQMISLSHCCGNCIGRYSLSDGHLHSLKNKVDFISSLDIKHNCTRRVLPELSGTQLNLAQSTTFGRNPTLIISLRTTSLPIVKHGGGSIIWRVTRMEYYGLFCGDSLHIIPIKGISDPGCYSATYGTVKNPSARHARHKPRSWFEHCT